MGLEILDTGWDQRYWIGSEIQDVIRYTGWDQRYWLGSEILDGVSDTGWDQWYWVGAVTKMGTEIQGRTRDTGKDQ